MTDRSHHIDTTVLSMRKQLADLAEELGETKIKIPVNPATGELSLNGIMHMITTLTSTVMSLRDDTMLMRAMSMRVFAELPEDTQNTVLSYMQACTDHVSDQRRKDAKEAKNAPTVKSSIITPGSSKILS